MLNKAKFAGEVSRRQFVAGVAGMGAAALLPDGHAWADTPAKDRVVSPFRLSVITDEISQDFDHACSVAANEFHLNWVEVRNVWGKSPIELEADKIAEMQDILAKYKLRVTDFASPLFKVSWKGAPPSKFGGKHDFGEGSKSFEGQTEVLEKCIAFAKTFQTDKIRCFDFWRLDDVAPYREAIHAKLSETAQRLQKEGLLLVLENEQECNTANGAEAAATLAAVKDTNFRLNWDPANAGMSGDAKPYPDSFHLLPVDRIAHCHCKDVGPKDGGGMQWLPVGKGIMDWPGQFAALHKAGYRGAVSMETHWKGGGTPEECTRVSIAGMFAALRQAGCLAG